MRISLMGDLGDDHYELVWEDGELRGTERLVDRFAGAAEEAGDDALAFINAVERGLPERPNLVVWPEEEGRTPGTGETGQVASR